jgi:hypothetical protein
MVSTMIGRAADAVALVADFLVVHAFEVAGGLVDVALDGVGGMLAALALSTASRSAGWAAGRRRPGARPP